MKRSEISRDVLDALKRGVVIPAMPLSLDANRKMDQRYQRAIARYYLDAGAGGIAVGVHTTQFEIRDPKINLYRKVLEIVRQEFDDFHNRAHKPLIRISGIVGKTDQAVDEAVLSVELGYQFGLLSLAAFKGASNSEIIAHCKRVAEEIPLIGFYLQPAVGGRKLDKDFWRAFAEIDNVVAIKMAPFNRYQTMDVVRGVAESGRSGEIALYTGNDDNILVDLLTKYSVKVGDKIIEMRIVGGLLGHWAVWTKRAVELLEKVHHEYDGGDVSELLTLAAKITDSNAAFFDAANDFKGCITGLHEVLRRQGLMKGIWTLNQQETLSPGQMAEIDRIYDAYPELNDDSFIRENLERWLTR
ncbi:MAG: dihydrodipicolinate synthase family protein [Bacteroidota bacterium]